MNVSFKDLVPPILLALARKLNPEPQNPYGWFGDFLTWEDAKRHCSGYDDSNILKKIIDSTQLVVSGRAKYERDSISFDHIEYSWPILASLLGAGLSNSGNLLVVDFGGSLGSTFYQNKDFLKNLQTQWAVVEQNSFVEIGNRQFSSNNLQFYHSIEDSIANKGKHVLLLSSVIQYLEQPYQWIEKFLSFEFPLILIDRTAFINSSQRLTIQRVPPDIYEASYPCYFFNENEFLSKFSEKYDLIADFPSYCDGEQIADDWKKLYWKGFIFKLK